ncbi:hypothetical protein GF319_12835 [Candidatus Bathyarchaeota archaeon]|nr:hypothetical protein [Candidatus Bathyarchaeota archaeon]
METQTVSAPWILKISWEELATLSICLGLDLIEYIAPIFLTPLIGDVIDFIGFIFCVVYYNFLGIFALAELIPGLDIVPFFTMTWLIWYYMRRRRLQKRLDQELEQWL